jgi:hypothetical protein
MAIIADDDLHNMKDDMVAFIAGHGLRRFNGYVREHIPSIRWESDETAEAWKDFIELAKESGSSFVTMNDVVLEDLDVDAVIDELKTADFRDENFINEAEWLRGFVGKTGFVQIGFPYQGVMFLYETSTHWYDRYEFWLDPEEFGLTAEDLEDEEDDE